jgi:hypothetical protein
MPYSLRVTVVEALHNPLVETKIMLEFLPKNLLGNMSLVPTNKLFKSPLGLFFECCGITRAVPIIINKTKVYQDFHIYAILEFDLLIGYPIEKLFQEKPFDGSLDEKLGKTTSATPIVCPKSPMAKHFPNLDLFEEVKFIFPFISPRIPSKIERSSPSLEPKSCPSDQPNVVLNSDREPTLILHDRFYAMDMPKAPTLETQEKDFTVKHESLSFETPHFSCSLLESLLCLLPSAPTRITTTS